VRPVILISTDCDIESSDSLKLQADYVRAVYMAGGLPLVAVPPMECGDASEAAAELCSLARGLVLTYPAFMVRRRAYMPARPGGNDVRSTGASWQ